ncbi:acetolactate decarboxylase [Litoribacter ruber]|uniref:acetolactate decarboxylase n=1 Tax=Litoribacter ruber TaxID=702568 RepID=UPI00293D4186|nr:acetolactate decarboxylase [Litoribacter ruber]
MVSDTEMKVEETYQMKAPFFGYANIPSWTEQELPDSISSIKELEQYLDKVTQNSTRPFMFRLTGEVDHALIHIVNLPEGSKVSSPEEAHRGQQDYKLQDEAATILGFFSTEQKAIFTHHDTYLHMHLITEDREKMGHLDEVEFGKGKMRLYLPE